MILYHPIDDSNHCSYRLIAVLSRLEVAIPYERWRLLDFYYLFPSFLKDIKPWPSGIARYKAMVKDIREPFEKTPNKKKLFFQMKPSQDRAALGLVSKGIIDADGFSKGLVTLAEGKLPKSFLDVLEEDAFLSSSVFEVLIEGLASTKWEGGSGIKSRTGLLEYKYDE